MIMTVWIIFILKKIDQLNYFHISFIWKHYFPIMHYFLLGLLFLTITHGESLEPTSQSFIDDSNRVDEIFAMRSQCPRYNVNGSLLNINPSVRLFPYVFGIDLNCPKYSQVFQCADYPFGLFGQDMKICFYDSCKTSNQTILYYDDYSFERLIIGLIFLFLPVILLCILLPITILFG